MRVLRAVAWLISLSALTFAADLKIRVVDPHSEGVANAQVSWYRAGDSTPLGTLTTSGEGMVLLAGLGDSSFRLQVLAPGFARRRLTFRFRTTPCSPCILHWPEHRRS